MKKNFYENPLPPEWRARLAQGDFEMPTISDEQRRDYAEMVRRRAELQESFPGEHVAMLRGKVVAHHPSWSEVYRLLREQGLAGDDVAIRYVRHPHAMAELL